MTAGSWEDASCPLCPPGTDSQEIFACSDRLREPEFKNYRVRVCSGCGLKYLSPRPATGTTAEFYQAEGYDPFLSVKGSAGLFDRAFSFAREAMLAWKKTIVAKIVKRGGSVLDIGCGTGEFLSKLSDNYATIGVEPEPIAARWASERLGLRVYTGYLNTVPADVTELDLITMWHVLEHIPDPIAALKDIHNRLKAGGKLLLALPNISSFDANVYKSGWVAVDAPRHLWHFSPLQVRKIAEQTGFKLVKQAMLPLDTFYNILWSERTLITVRRWPHIILAPFRILLTTIGSLIWGLLSGQHSGMYYLLVKK